MNDLRYNEIGFFKYQKMVGIGLFNPKNVLVTF